MAQELPLGQVLITVEDSWSHSDTQHSVGLLWTSDQPVAETSTWQHTTLTTNIHAPGGIRTQIPESERPQTHTLDRAATGIGIKYSQGHQMKDEEIGGTVWNV